jgi:hypothetical protein
MKTRREFLQTSLRAGLLLPVSGLLGHLGRGLAWAASAAPPLFARFPDLRRHFLFEYYPWYATDPVRHWNQWDRVPPDDIAATCVPRLGAYDSRSSAVLESHARWIVESGAGAVNLSWWGPDSFEDRNVHRVMDVFGAHGLRVTFHLEPYDENHARRYAEDVLYLLREYGEKRHFDAFLVLKNADGAEGPVLKGFRTILPRESKDCHGESHPVSDYITDGQWRRQTDTLRNTLRGDFDHVTLLADSLDFGRVLGAGFDGVAIYDNFVPPSSYAGHAASASRAGLLFSFNTNPGFDAIEPRDIDPEGCYAPTPFEPPAEGLDWARAESAARAAALSEGRIRESFASTLAVQTDSGLLNAQRGFFLVYLTSFNEWHEGHAFEPMQDAALLSRAQRRIGYHNPERGDYRLATLTALLDETLAPSASPEEKIPA